MLGGCRFRAWVGSAWLGLVLAVPAGAVEAQAVSFKAADGLRIAADYYPPPAANRGTAPMVMLLHMDGSDRTAWQPLIAPLHEAGCAILALDLRGHGDSASTETRDAAGNRDPELFKKMQNDVLGAYNWLAEQSGVDRARFALVGAGVGASVALQYAAHDRSVDVVVCLSPGLRECGIDSAGDMHQITGRRVLLLATENERDAPYTLKARGSAGVDVQIRKGANAHGTGMFGAIGGIERDIADYVKDGVGEPTTTTVYGSIERDIYHPSDSGWVKRISPSNLRYYSSPAEAGARGLRATKSKSPRSGSDEPENASRPRRKSS